MGDAHPNCFQGLLHNTMYMQLRIPYIQGNPLVGARSLELLTGRSTVRPCIRGLAANVEKVDLIKLNNGVDQKKWFADNAIILWSLVVPFKFLILLCSFVTVNFRSVIFFFLFFIRIFKVFDNHSMIKCLALIFVVLWVLGSVHAIDMDICSGSEYKC